MKLYNFLEATVFNRKQKDHSISVAAILKPLPIGSVSVLSRNAPLLIRERIMYQLTRISNLENKLRTQSQNSKYQLIKQKNEIDIQFVNKARAIHMQYFSRILYMKSKYRVINVNVLDKLSKGYERRLFILNQQYQKMKIQMSPYSSQNSDMDNNTKKVDNGQTTETIV